MFLDPFEAVGIVFSYQYHLEVLYKPAVVTSRPLPVTLQDSFHGVDKKLKVTRQVMNHASGSTTIAEKYWLYLLNLVGNKEQKSSL